jgi:hypothetical protein
MDCFGEHNMLAPRKILVGITALHFTLISGVTSSHLVAAPADAPGKAGSLQLTLKDHSPLSSPADIAKRMPSRGTAPYDLSSEPFDVYVPKEAGPDGKYGLLVLLHFREFGKPPAAWQAILDKHHLIWMGDSKNTDGRQLAQRVGLVLDAVYNAEKTWPIDPGRVFLFNCTSEVPTSGMGLYYPDVFDGTFQCSTLEFFESIPGKVKGFRWPPKLPKLKGPLLDQAKSRRYYLVDRLEDHSTQSTQNQDIFDGGYQKAGFADAKLAAAKTDIVRNYEGMAPDWFDEGITYLDVKPDAPAVAMASAKPIEPVHPAADSKPRRMPAADTTPPPAKPVAAAAPPPPAPPPQPPAVESPADLAKRALSLAKSYIAAENYDIARTKLQKIVTDYPDTPAAKEAASLLSGIKDK